jgi:hypothetical protein
MRRTSLVASVTPTAAGADASSFADALRAFTWHGKRTREQTTSAGERSIAVPQFLNEFWTSRQRAAHSLHEISYRACFKPQLPRFFIERLTRPGDRVLDPFSGRGTTALEAALLGRVPIASDINPLSRILLEPRLAPPALAEVKERLSEIPWSAGSSGPDDLLVFYHRETLRQIGALRTYLLDREAAGKLDPIDRWIRMVAVNRLTGHSSGFFSVYTMPPNQAVSARSQARINARRNQTPAAKDVARIIARKSASLLSDADETTRRALGTASRHATILTQPAAAIPEIRPNSIDLVVTSPPFLDIVQYANDNWLRCWFCGIDPAEVAITMARRVDEWRVAMQGVFVELQRVVRPGKFVAFEVGEVQGGAVKLDEIVLPAAIGAGFEPALVLINAQRFTKTANCWGVANNRKGTNTNRIVLVRKPG